jgi:hypothetical protein
MRAGGGGEDEDEDEWRYKVAAAADRAVDTPHTAVIGGRSWRVVV